MGEDFTSIGYDDGCRHGCFLVFQALNRARVLLKS
jgi:hypothetical protein